MKPIDQQIAIAQLTGWTGVVNPSNTSIVEGYRPSDGLKWGAPPFLTSLDAMRTALDTLTDMEWNQFLAWLLSRTSRSHGAARAALSVGGGHRHRAGRS